jgi:mono/diheme cytochrome c family protein
MGVLLLGTGIVFSTGHGVVVQQPQPQTVLQAIPIYGSSYQNSQAAPSAMTEELLKLIVEELKGLREEVQLLREGNHQPALGGAPSVLAVNPKLIVTKNCGGCHNANDAAKKGGDLILLEKNGSLIQLSSSVKNAVFERVGNGTMPPSGKINEDDKKVILSLYPAAKKK